MLWPRPGLSLGPSVSPMSESSRDAPLVRQRAILLGCLLLLLVVPTASCASGASGALGSAQQAALRSSAPLSSGAVPVNLSESATGFQLSSQFWGTTVSAESHSLADEVDLLNATPTRTMVWPGAKAGDDLDVLNDTLLSVSGKTLSWHPPATNETTFISECLAMDCSAILQVPGEIDDPAFAAQVVNYTENTLGFHPAYWEIGNEPEFWKHWQQPWNQWNSPPQTGKALITPGEYAWEVHNYTLAMKAVDPSIRILGLPGTARTHLGIPMTEWINATVSVNGASLAGVAYHLYTAGRTGPETLADFYAPDAYGSNSLPGSLVAARRAVSTSINATCPGCKDPLVIVDELGSALSHYRYGNLSRGFAGGLSMTVSEMQGMTYNATTLDTFAAILNTSNSWFSLSGAERPDYTDYSEFLSQLGSMVYPVSFQVPSGPSYNGANSSLNENLFGVATRAEASGGRSDLLVVNVNASTSVSLLPQLPGISAGVSVGVWSWQGTPHFSATNQSAWVTPSTTAPLFQYLPAGPSGTWVLPPQSITLFEAYPTGSFPITFNSTGLPSGQRWYLDVDGATEQTSQGNLTELLPPGNVGLSPIAIPLPLGKNPAHGRERMEAFPPNTVTVTDAPQTVPVPFRAQWALRVSAEPPTGGTATPTYSWANASAATSLTATPAPGYAFAGWVGSGHGSYTGPRHVATFRAEGPVNETAEFAPGFPVTFAETGLPSGSTWTVSIFGTEVSSQSPTLEFDEPNGTYLYQVEPVPAFTILGATAWFLVSGSAIAVSIEFAPIHDLFQVVWEETGLPTGSPWSVVVGGEAENSSSSWATAYLVNGTYPYIVPRVLQGSANPSSGEVDVEGTRLVIPLVFSPPKFALTVAEAGLPVGSVWQLTIAGEHQNVSAATSVLLLANGTYSWSVVAPGGYESRPSSGSISIVGSSASLSVTFYPSPPTYTPFGQGYVEPLVVVLVFVVAAVVAWAAVVRAEKRRRTSRPPGRPPSLSPPAARPGSGSRPAGFARRGP